MKDILKDAVEYKDSMNVPKVDCDADQKTKDRAEELKDAIFDLMLAGNLDQTDIAIINARNCSPMPSLRDVAARVGIGLARVHERTEHIIKLMPKDLQIEMKQKRNDHPSYI